jgi:iduronate 2-sulfatase
MERLTDKSWFIGAGFHRPHDPFIVGKKYVAQYPAGSLKLNENPKNASTLHPHALGGGLMLEAFDKLNDRDRMDFLTHYYAGVTQTDVITWVSVAGGTRTPCLIALAGHRLWWWHRA